MKRIFLSCNDLYKSFLYYKNRTQIHKNLQYQSLRVQKNFNDQIERLYRKYEEVSETSGSIERARPTGRIKIAFGVGSLYPDGSLVDYCGLIRDRMTTTIRARREKIICHSGLVRDPPPLRFRRSARHVVNIRFSCLAIRRYIFLMATPPCPSLHYAGGIVSRKQNGYEKTNTE